MTRYGRRPWADLDFGGDPSNAQDQRRAGDLLIPQGWRFPPAGSCSLGLISLLMDLELTQVTFDSGFCISVADRAL